MKKMSKILKSKFLSLLTIVFLFSQNCYSVLDLKRIQNNKIINLIEYNEKYNNFLTKHNYHNGYFTFAVDTVDNNKFVVITEVFDNKHHFVGETVSKMRFCGMHKYKIDDILNILNSENFEEFEEPFIESIIFSENSKLPIMHESANVLRIYMEKDVEEGDKFFYIIPDSEKSISLDNLILVQKGMRGKKEITRKFKFGPFYQPFNSLVSKCLYEIKDKPKKEERKENNFKFLNFKNLFFKTLKPNGEETKEFLIDKEKNIKNYEI